jgi:hypothetical protein
MELTFILKNDSCPAVSNPRRSLCSVSLSFSIEISSLAELIIRKSSSVPFLKKKQWHELGILRNLKRMKLLSAKRRWTEDQDISTLVSVICGLLYG